MAVPTASSRRRMSVAARLRHQEENTGPAWATGEIWLAGAVAREPARHLPGAGAFRVALGDHRVWVLTFMFFRFGLSSYGIMFGIRQIVKQMSGLSNTGAVGIWSGLGVFWTMPPLLFTGPAAAGGLALINAIGNLGGFVGPYMMGLARSGTGGFSIGLIGLAGVLLAGAIAAVALKHSTPRAQPVAV